MTQKALVVAKFEFTKTVRRKGFILGTLGLPLLILFIMGLTLYTGAGIGTAMENQTTGYVDGTGFVEPASGYVPYTDLAAGKSALVAGEIHTLVVIPADYLQNRTLTVYTMDASLMGSTGSNTAVQEFLAQNVLRHENVSEEATQAVLSPSSPSVIVLDESGNPKGSQELAGFILPFAMTMVLALGILTSSGYLMQGIGEEKESRRGEFLLSYCSAENLLAGKIIGYAAVSLLQMGLWIGMALLVVAATPLSAIFSGLQLSGLVGIAVVYFVLGYFLFSVSIACTASLAPSVREAQQDLCDLLHVRSLPAHLLTVPSRGPELACHAVFNLLPLHCAVHRDGPAHARFRAAIPDCDQYGDSCPLHGRPDKACCQDLPDGYADLWEAGGTRGCAAIYQDEVIF